jgi:hypothetical protein
VAPTAAAIQQSGTTGSTATAIAPASHGGGESGKGGSGSGGSGNSGSGNGGHDNSGPGNGGHDNSGPRNGDDNRAELTGTAQAVVGICPALSMTIAGRAVTTNATTEFKGVLCTALTSGQRVEVKGTIQPNGSVLATRLKAEKPEDENDNDNDHENDNDNANEVVGAIASKTGTCPALTFKIGTTTVTTTLATTFDDVTCTALANGMEIEAKGVRQTDGSLMASRIEPTGAR